MLDNNPRNPRHHLHVRQRIQIQHQKYPSPNPNIRLLDHIVIVIAILGPIITVPQLLLIFENQDASGLSFLTWSSYLVFSAVWLIYGIIHHEKPIIITNSLYVTVDIAIIAAMIYYSDFLQLA